MPLNKIAVAVCDTDREYRDRFVTYLVERKAEEYAVSAFSMPEKLLEALEEEKPDLAICGTGFEEMAERLAGYDIPVLVLQETMADAVAEPVTYGSVPESCRGICRYQSMEVILHEAGDDSDGSRQQKDGECRNGNGGNWCLLSDLS